MGKNEIAEYWNAKDPRPLVEIIVHQLGYNMRVVEKWHGKLYVIDDWVYAVSGSKTKDTSKAWRTIKAKMEREGLLSTITSLTTLPISTSSGVQQMDVCDEKGLYFITQQMPPSATVVKVRKYLANAGVLVDQIRIDPEKGVDAAREAFRMQGKEEEWIDERLGGKLNRIRFTNALKAAVCEIKQIDYGLATNNLYVGLWQRTKDMLHTEMNLSKGANLRDNQSRLALSYQSIAEELCARRLGNEENISQWTAAGIVYEVALIIGKQVHQISKLFGIDIATDTPLDISETFPRVKDAVQDLLAAETEDSDV